MIEKLIADFLKTFGRPGIFLAVEPKLERADRNDPNSQQVQARDKNGGGLKWTATVAVAVQSFGREKYENLSITLTSPTQPCANIAPGAPVMVDGLEQGLMKQSNGFSQFWSAAGIRQVAAQSPASSK
jgi:hypothetical protein